MAQEAKAKVELSAPQVSAAEATTVASTETACQSDFSSVDCKSDLVNALNIVTIIFVPAILTILFMARVFKKNTSWFNFLVGIVILCLSLWYTIFVSENGLTEYLYQYPYVLGVMIFGVSLGINLVSHLLTEQVKEEEVKIESPVKQIIKDKKVEQEIENLTNALEQAKSYSENLKKLQLGTEAERDRYQSELEYIKSRAEKTLVKKEPSSKKGTEQAEIIEPSHN